MFAKIDISSRAYALRRVLKEVAELANKRRSTWGSKFLKAAVILSNYPYRITFFGPMKKDHEAFVVEDSVKTSDPIGLLAFPHVLSVERVVELSPDALSLVREDCSLWGIIFEVRRRYELIETDPTTYIVTRWDSPILEDTETEVLEQYGEHFAVGVGAWFFEFKAKHAISERYFFGGPPIPQGIPAGVSFTIYGDEMLKTATKIKRLISRVETGFSSKDRGRLVEDLVKNGMILGKTDPHTLLFYAPGRPYKEIESFLFEALENRPCLICGSPVKTRVLKSRICKSKPCQGRFDRLKQKARELYDRGITEYTDLCQALRESHLRGQEFLKQKGRVSEIWQANDLEELIALCARNAIFAEEEH